MINLGACSDEELSERLSFLYTKIDSILKDSGKIIEELARLRNESLIIENELRSRKDVK